MACPAIQEFEHKHASKPNIQACNQLIVIFLPLLPLSILNKLFLITKLAFKLIPVANLLIRKKCKVDLISLIGNCFKSIPFFLSK